MKKGLLFTLLLICSNMVFAYDFEANGIYYNVTSTTELTAEVTSGDNNYSGVVTIPSSVVYKSRTLNVTAIGDGAFSNDKELIEVKIPNSVTSIGYMSFRGCSKLTTLSIPNSVTSIDGFAFDDCTSLVDFRIEDGDGILSFDSGSYLPYLFSNCPLKTIYIGRNLSYTSNSTYGYSPFYENQTIESVSFGNKVTSIPERLFDNCAKINNITIPSNILEIGKSAFYYCSNLSNITMNCSNTTIKEFAFYGCPIVRVNIPNIYSWCQINFEKYDSNPLCYNSGNLYSNGVMIKKLVIPSNVTKIKQHAFRYCKGLESVVISNGVVSIENSAFCGCSNVISISIPSSITNIASDVFKNCTSLSDVHINDLSSWCNIDFANEFSTPLYYGNLYLDNKQVTEIVIPNYINEIKAYTFGYCKLLKSVSIPCGVENIGKFAFIGCSELTDVNISNGVKTVGWGAFRECDGLVNLTIPSSVESIDYYAFEGCTALRDLCIEDGEELLSLPCHDFAKRSGLFYDCPLERLYLGRNLQYKADYRYENSPFYGRNLMQSVVLGKNVTSLKDCALQNCNAIKEMYILTETPPIVGANNFADYHYANTTLYIPLGTLNAYQNADIWKDFWEIVEMDMTSVDNVFDKTALDFEFVTNGFKIQNINSGKLTVYSSNGSVVKSIQNYCGETIVLDKGIYIVDLNGQSVKVVF